MTRALRFAVYASILLLWAVLVLHHTQHAVEYWADVQAIEHEARQPLAADSASGRGKDSPAPRHQLEDR